jgi:uncharacterized protein YcfJ
MLYRIHLCLSFFAVIAMSGCTGSEVVPDNATQTGAVTGALAGSVIGYNTAGHHRGRGAAVGAVAGAAAGALIGNAIDENTPPPEETSGWHE